MKSVSQFKPTIMCIAEGILRLPALGLESLGHILRLAMEMAADKASGEALRRRFDRVVSTHSALISRLCFSYAADNDDFQDLRQDVLLNIWKGLAAFRGDSSSLTWIYRVTLNTCVSTVRKRNRGPATERLDTLPVDLADDVEESAMRERLEMLHSLISELSPVDKAIVTMWLDECSYDEIAEVVGMSRNNIGLRLHRIRERWRKQANIS